LRVWFVAALATVLALAFGVAFAAELVDVKANSGKTPIYHVYIYNKFDCSFSEPPSFKIGRQAANGTIKAGIVKARFKDSHERCPGKRVYVLEVTYKPKRGFRGSDRGSLDMRYPAYGGLNYQKTRTVKFSISVR
jgi:hypothetical protein